MDWSLFHAINTFVYHHEDIADTGQFIENWLLLLFAGATFALWLLDRPRGAIRWRFASAAALTSATVALAINQLIGKIYDRQRPFAGHRGVHVFAARSHDPSFPSDHASAAFGIAFAVLLLDTVAGLLFLGAAIAIAVGRVVVGVHYPGDVAAGALVGLAAALLVVRGSASLLRPLVALVARVTDPVLAPIWRFVAHR